MSIWMLKQYFNNGNIDKSGAIFAYTQINLTKNKSFFIKKEYMKISSNL